MTRLTLDIDTRALLVRVLSEVQCPEKLGDAILAELDKAVADLMLDNKCLVIDNQWRVL